MSLSTLRIIRHKIANKLLDRFDAMRVFTRVVERRSFTLAAEDLGPPRSTVTDAVKQLEARLGVQLLQRTTRHVGPTLDGEAYHRRCLALIADLEDAEAAFGGAKPKGLLRVDVHGTLARHFVLPRLPDFLAEYPAIELYMSEGDRLVDLVREGIDCVLRVGDLQDSDMVARRVAMLTEITCAAPAYIERFGMPASVDALDGHRMVGFRSSATAALLPLEFILHGVVAAGRLGLGLIQVPRYHIESDLESGTLVAVLPDYPPRRRRSRCSIPATDSFHRASAYSSIGSSERLLPIEADAPGPAVSPFFLVLDATDAAIERVASVRA